MNKPRILASIVNYGTPVDTIQCVKGLYDLARVPDKIVVVDNASTDDSIQIIQEANLQVQLLVANDNGGYAAGHQLSVNYALEHGYDAIWILNPDLELHPDALNALLKAWESMGEGVFGSISLQSPDDDTILFTGAHELDGDNEISSYNPFKGQSLQSVAKAQPIRKVTAVEGFSLFVPLSIIRQYGFMDHRYFMYGEETIWCYDLRKKGVPIFIVPVSIVYHKGFGSLGENGASSPVVTYYRMRNAIYWKRKHYGLKWLDVLKRKGGPLAQMKFFIKYLLGGKSWRLSQTRNFVENIAILHALVNYKGKWHWLH